MSTSTLPTHPLTGITAVGWRKARPGEAPGLYPVWPIFGGAEDDDEGEPDDAEKDDEEPDDDPGDGGGTDDDADPEGADDLGDKGKRALDAMKAKLKAERERRRAAETERDSLKAKPGEGDDAEQVRAEAERAATAKANARIVRAELKAAAKGRLADPADALVFIDTTQFEVDEDGQLDEDDLAEAIDNLLKTKPHLAAATAKRFQGTGDGGARKGTGGVKQLTEQDVKRLTPEQIDEAHRKGQLRDYLGG